MRVEVVPIEDLTDEEIGDLVAKRIEYVKELLGKECGEVVVLKCDEEPMPGHNIYYIERVVVNRDAILRAEGVRRSGAEQGAAALLG